MYRVAGSLRELAAEVINRNADVAMFEKKGLIKNDTATSIFHDE